jgi:tRNA C32,U32 (ribose-2'-O)-methylase TrmJ
MGVYYIPQVYKAVVEEKARAYFEDILAKSPESKRQAQQDLSALIQKETEVLKSDNLSEEEVKEKLYLLRRATLLRAQIVDPNPDLLMLVLRQIAEREVTEKEIIEEAKSRGIGIDDENATYIV